LGCPARAFSAKSPVPQAFHDGISTIWLIKTQTQSTVAMLFRVTVLIVDGQLPYLDDAEL
jgi:hypothetical protein